MNTEQTKATIGAKIMWLVTQEGKTIRQAIDEVCGEGTVNRIAGEIYDALKK